jgi:hypothetical protein
MAASSIPLQPKQEILNVLAPPHIAAVTTPSFRKDSAKRLASAELIATTEGIAACRDHTEFPASGARRRVPVARLRYAPAYGAQWDCAAPG